MPRSQIPRFQIPRFQIPRFQIPSALPSIDSAADGAVMVNGVLYSVNVITPPEAPGSASFASMGVVVLVT